MGNLSGAMDRNTSIVWAAILLQLFLMVSCTLSQTTESSPPDSQAGRCSRNLQHTFDPLMNNLVENIRLELANFQQAQGSQGTNIVISNENDLATLVAEKLFVKIKDDLITSGTGINSEEVSGLKERIQLLENDKSSKIYFSAYNDEGGEVTGQLKFPKVITNLGSAFDGSRGVFKTPVKGVYTFTFSGQQSNNIGPSGSSFIDVYVERNGETVFTIYDDTNSDEKDRLQNINSIFSLELNENDTVQLVIHARDRLYAIGNARLIFMGQLVVAT